LTKKRQDEADQEKVKKIESQREKTRQENLPLIDS